MKAQKFNYDIINLVIKKTDIDWDEKVYTTWRNLWKPASIGVFLTAIIFFKGQISII